MMYLGGKPYNNLECVYLCRVQVFDIAVLVYDSARLTKHEHASIKTMYQIDTIRAGHASRGCRNTGPCYSVCVTKLLIEG